MKLQGRITGIGAACPRAGRWSSDWWTCAQEQGGAGKTMSALEQWSLNGPREAKIDESTGWTNLEDVWKTLLDTFLAAGNLTNHNVC